MIPDPGRSHMPQSNQAHVPQLLGLCSRAREPRLLRPCGKFSFSVSHSSKYSGLISLKIDWFDLLVVQRTLKSLLQYHNLKNISSSVLSLLYGPVLTYVHDYWKNHGFDYMNSLLLSFKLHEYRDYACFVYFYFSKVCKNDPYRRVIKKN